VAPTPLTVFAMLLAMTPNLAKKGCFPFGIVGGIDLIADFIGKYGLPGCQRSFNG
jgi:hypothetical protein